MNPNYSHTITLYCCLKAADSPDRKDHWYRTVLDGCYYKSAVTRVESGVHAGMQNTYTVRIPASDRYRPYREWCGIPDAERGKYFTLHLDAVVIGGECPDEISSVSGNTAAQMMNKHKPDAFKVTAVADNTKKPVERHYRLGG